MKNEVVEILLVEDNPSDAEMTIRALRKNHIANHIMHLDDGAEALDFIFCTGDFTKRSHINPKGDPARFKNAQSRRHGSFEKNQSR